MFNIGIEKIENMQSWRWLQTTDFTKQKYLWLLVDKQLQDTYPSNSHVWLQSIESTSFNKHVSSTILSNL